MPQAALFSAIQSPRPKPWLRAVSVLMVSCLVFTTYASGFQAAGEEFANALQHYARRPGKFTDKPGQIFRGTNPGRDPIGRAGMWTPRLLRDRAMIRWQERQAAPMAPAELYASVNPIAGFVNSVIAQGGDGSGGGNPGGGEGGAPGGGTTGGTGGTEGSNGGTGGAPGGSTGSSGGGGALGGAGGGGGVGNTNTGNRHVAYGIVGWSALGQNGVSFVLHHNSIGDYSFDLGKGWSHSYDVKIGHTPGSSAIIRYGDGSEIPYTEAAGVFTPPAGYHDDLVLNGGGTWTLTTKGQAVLGFNAAGHLITVTDRNGNTTTITRNGSNKITTISDGVGRNLDFTYNGNGLIETVTDPADRLWTFNYDGNLDMIDIEYPALSSVIHTRDFTYNANHDILTETDRRGKTWTFTYDSSERLTSFTNPLSKTWSYSYTSSATTITDPLSNTTVHNYSSGMLASTVDEESYSDAMVWDGDKNLTQYTDKRGKVWEYTYDGNGNMLTAEDPLSNVTEYTYNGDNSLTSVEDALGHTWISTYDSNENLLTVTDPLSRTSVTNTYTSDGDVATTKDALNRTTTLTYDSYGNLTDVTDPASVTTSYDHNILGWRIQTTDGAGSDYDVNHDEWGRMASATEPGNAVSSLTYDEENNVLSATNALGRTGYRTYDNLGRLTSTTNSKSETQTYGYNDMNWLTSVTNGRSYTRNYVHSDRGEVTSLTLPDSAVESWSYDGNGFTTAYTNPLTQTINYAYDDAGRQTGVDYPTGTDTSFNYDAANRATSMVDSTGTSSWTYNNGNEVTQLTTPQGTLNYTYNTAGQRATMVETGVGTTTYTYDSFGRLDNLQNPFSEVTTLTYDSAGRVSRQTYDNGTYDAYIYDNQSRVTNINTKNSSNVILAARDYTYDAISQVTQLVEGAVTTTYSYDFIGQLTSENRSGYSSSYTYDANGNRLTRTVNGSTETYSYDSGDKLTTISGGSDPRTFYYDAAGRMTSISRSGGSDTTTLAYNYQSHLTNISRLGFTTNTFTYNALSARTGKTDSSGSFVYARDGVSVTSPITSDGGANFTPGISRRASGASVFSHSSLKSIDLQTNALGSSLATRQYDAFGGITVSSGGHSGPFGFGGGFGYYEDNDYGLKLLGHRYYDSSTGRYLTRDPAKDERNWYQYGGGVAGPVGIVDADGLRVTFLYKVYQQSEDGLTWVFKKWGISYDPEKRYTKKWLASKNAIVINTGFGATDRDFVRGVERQLEMNAAGEWNYVKWAGKGPYNFKVPDIVRGSAAVYMQQDDIVKSRPDLSKLDYAPVVGDAKGIVDVFTGWLDSWVPRVRAGLQGHKSYDPLDGSPL